MHAALLALALLSLPAGPRVLEALPGEHDDLGRSDEPDFAGTGVLGPWLGGASLDADLDGRGEPEDRWMDRGWGPVAPGCSDAGGRQPSGTCALGLAGGGRANPYAPRGAVGLLDAQLRFQPGVHVEVNRKLADAGLRRAGAPWVPDGAPLAPVGVFAWFGAWRDADGDGVIGDGAGEFAWRGAPARLDLAVWPWAPAWVAMHDHTADPRPGARGWFAAHGALALAYDPGALHTTVLAVAEAGPWPPEASPMRDVDVASSLSPGLEDLLLAAVAPPGPAAWVRGTGSASASPGAGPA